MMQLDTRKSWTTRKFTAIGAVLAVAAIPVRAATVPFTEDFPSNTANWFANSAGTVPVVFNASGGPDGGSFVSSAINFVGVVAGGPPPLMFRGQENFASSGGAFLGNWITDGVTDLSLYVRHDAGVPLDFFTRIAAAPSVMPPVGGAISNTLAVPSGVWTPISIAINPTNAGLLPEFSNFSAIFSNVARIQIGISPPPALFGANQTVTFGLDKVSIVPEPASLLLLGCGGLVLTAQRRRRSAGR